MRVVSFWSYSLALGAGAALLGLVVGGFLKPLPAAVSLLLAVVGLVLLGLASLLAKRNSRWWKTKSSSGH
jgi:uncharacterized membrane protein (Fun14 family)